jgi:pilus assembly protein CpaB
MPAKTILALLFLVALGVVAVLGLRAVPRQLNPEPSGRSEMLVATAALAPGTLLRAKDVAWQLVTGGSEAGLILRPRSAAGNPSHELDQQARAEVYGAALRTPVARGNAIARDAIVKPGDRDFLQVVLSPRARAIAIPVMTSGASTGLLSPGDRVDVILTQTFKNDPALARRSVSETVVENLRVLAIDAPDTKPSAGGSSFGRTVTLEVTPEQAERVNVAAELGKLSLTLRNITTAEAIGVVETPDPAARVGIKPIWAGDVSPALADAGSPNKAVAAAQPVVEVIRGTKTAAVKVR